MWEHYTKTFLRMRVVIWSVSIAIGFWSHRLGASAVFFAMMQISALIGAQWAARLKNKIERASGAAATRVMS
jgi:hypothetical protein